MLRTLSPSTEGNGASALLQGADGNLYGTVLEGGAHAAGTAFRVGLDGTFTVLHTFDPAIEGYKPGGLIQAGDGRFFGISIVGTPDSETFFKRYEVFSMTASGAVTAVRIIGFSDEGIKSSALVLASDGNFYGTTSSGGASNLGTVFRMTRAGAITVLYSFAGGSDGGIPEASLIRSDGSLRRHPRSNSSGFFRLPDGLQSDAVGHRHHAPVFNAIDEGRYLRARRSCRADGNFYGTTYYGLGLNSALCSG